MRGGLIAVANSSIPIYFLYLSFKIEEVIGFGDGVKVGLATCCRDVVDDINSKPVCLR